MSTGVRFPIRLSLLVLLILISPLPSGAEGVRMALLEGACTLEGEIDHSGTKILFAATTPSAVTDSAVTDLTGHYQIGLAEGEYTVTMSHSGFLSHVVPDLLFGGESYVLDPVELAAGTMIDVSGEVGGDWPGGVHYMVVGDLHVAAGDSLVIHPGARVLFLGYYEMLVEGTLIAAGAEGDSVVFASGLPEPAESDWIRIHISGTESSLAMQYARVAHASSGIRLDDSNEISSQITDSIIQDCSSGVIISSSQVSVVHCRFERCTYCIGDYYSDGNRYAENLMTVDSSGRGIYVTGSRNTLCEDNIIKNARQGVCLYGTGTGTEYTTVQRNTMVACMYGIYCYSGPGNSYLVGNTILGSSEWGISVGSGSTGTARQNVVAWGYKGVNSYSSDFVTEYNNAWGTYGPTYGGSPPGLGQLVTTNANGDSCDTYFNISADPEFTDADAGDYTLLATSPCIDAGNPDPAFYDADGTVADLGAFPYHQDPLLPPVIDLTAAPTAGYSPLAVEFASVNTGGPILTYLWDFGDGSTSSTPHPVHVYTTLTPAAYTVSLTVTGPNAVQDAVVYADLISVEPAPSIPIAEFTAGPLTGYGPVQFTSLSVGVIDSLRWHFGDGETSDQTDPAHVYTAPGLYTVTLYAYGPGGLDTEAKPDYIEILTPDEIVAGFETTVLSDVAPAEVVFANTTIGTVDGYEWAFGDGDTSTVEHPTHLYENPGSYEAVLVATGPAGADTARATVDLLDPAPSITAIADVPADQGGQVYLAFDRSGHDGGAKSAEIYTVQRLDGDQWVTVQSGGATGDPAYTFLVSTLRDSTAEHDGWARFRVIAGMDEGEFASLPDSGYSVDNIPPGVPTGLSADYLTRSVVLDWSDAPEPDFQYYRIYRSAGGEYFLHAQTAESDFVDENLGVPGGYRYRVTALDHAGNESEPASVQHSPVSNETLPSRTVLHAAVPNPFNPSTRIDFDLARPSRVRLRVYDPAGRLVRTLLDGHRGAGRWQADWDGCDERGRGVSAGVYLYRLEAAGYCQTKRMVLIR